MAEISKIQIPGNSTPYDLYDSSAAHGLRTVNGNSLEGSGNVEIPDDQMIWFCTCSSAGSSTTKTIEFVDDPDTFSLVPGHTLRIYFSNGCTTSSQIKFTCTGVFSNINAYAMDSALTYTNLYYMWQAAAVEDFVYDGTAFVMVDSSKADTQYWGLVKLSSSTASTSTVLGANMTAFNSTVTLYNTRQQKVAPTEYTENTSYFTVADSDWGNVKLKIYGHLAELTGQLKVSTAISGSTTEYNLTNSGTPIPEQYRPSCNIDLLMSGSMYNVWLLAVTVNGGVTFSRYRYTNSYNTASVNSWLPFQVCWIWG